MSELVQGYIYYCNVDPLLYNSPKKVKRGKKWVKYYDFRKFCNFAITSNREKKKDNHFLGNERFHILK